MKEYSHYYKRVPYEYIDVYRVLELFNVTDPAIQHAVKKLLVAGGRGHKNLEKDVNEAIASLNRWTEMRDEEKMSLNTVYGPQGSEVCQTNSYGSVNGPAEFGYFCNNK